MQTRMKTRKITMKQGEEDPFIFFVYEKKDNLASDESLKTIGLILKKLEIPAKEIIVLARQVIGGNYNLFLQCDNYVSIYTKAQVKITEKLSRNLAALSNTLMNLGRSVPLTTPEITIRIDDEVEKKNILDVDPLLVKNIFETSEITGVTFKPMRPVAYVEPLGERTLKKDDVDITLKAAPGYSEMTKNFLVFELFEENRLARLSYYVPLLQRLMSMETKILIKDKVVDVIKVFTSHAAALNKYLKDTELNNATRGLPYNNVWSVYKRTTITPRLTALEQLKAQFSLDNDLQTLLNTLEIRIKDNSRKAVLDSELVQRVKGNFIRSMQFTALAYWYELKKNPALDQRVLEDYLTAFDSDLVPAENADGNQRLQNIAFSSNYSLNSFTEIAKHINNLKASPLRKNLLDAFESECKLEKCFIMEKGTETSTFKWTSYVTNANNPELLAEEEKSVAALIEAFYADSRQKLIDAEANAKEIFTPIKDEVVRIRALVPHINEQYEQLTIQIKKVEDQVAAFNVALTKHQKVVDDLQHKAASKFLTIHRPGTLLTEMKNISLKAVSAKKILDSLLAKIGAAVTEQEVDNALVAVTPELNALQDFKTEFDSKDADLTTAIIDGNNRLQLKRIDDQMRENLLWLRVALLDADFLKKNTTQFLCLGGTTVSLPGDDTDAIKVPRGAAEMIAELLKICDNNTDLSTIKLDIVVNTLTEMKKIAQAALNRSDSRMFIKVRKDPMQLFYQHVASLNLSFGSYQNLEPNQFPALDFTDVNSNWPAVFVHKAYELNNFKRDAFEKSNISSVTRPLENSRSSAEISVSSRRRSSVRV